MSAHSPTQFPGIYNVGTTAAAKTVTAAIIAWGDVSPSISDLRKFEQQNSLPTTPTSVVTTGIPSTDTASTIEWSLDSQAIVGMSGGVRQLNFYVSQSAAFGDVLVAINAAIQANAAQVVNMSFGICDTVGATSFDSSYFAVAIAQGQTFVASTGDFGSNPPNCSGTSVQYPSSSQYVVAVGGTSLRTNGSTYAGETAWSGSGGGIAKYTTIPFWQSIVPSLSGGSLRGVPDISFVADPLSGAIIYSNGSPIQVGGTSLSAPLFAATWARMLTSCGNLGFASPTLYAYAKGSPTIFNDVMSGSNGAYSATSGWDSVTGWGSININNFKTSICPGAAHIAATHALYLAYLGRPADPSGLAFWSSSLKNANAPKSLTELLNSYSTNTSVAALINSLASSTESQSFYNTPNNTAFITQVYNVLYNRNPDSTGLTYWLNRINNGDVSKALLPLAILQMGQRQFSSDAVISGNKFAVATNFTATLTTTQSAYYTGQMANISARHLLQNVTYSTSQSSNFNLYYIQPVYVSGYQSSINSAISAILAGVPY
ncbi:DUF4214 domain-containing protein [Pseudoduganella sp. LjRoot289]|uniref:DUF4214 domain-containing protein n=1 Tax=Pseudoduganella sp. LjRoot289 TaxID=3342314 RepID=UPI003ECF5887